MIEIRPIQISRERGQDREAPRMPAGRKCKCGVQLSTLNLESICYRCQTLTRTMRGCESEDKHNENNRRWWRKQREKLRLRNQARYQRKKR